MGESLTAASKSSSMGAFTIRLFVSIAIPLALIGPSLVTMLEYGAHDWSLAKRHILYPVYDLERID